LYLYTSCPKLNKNYNEHKKGLSLMKKYISGLFIFLLVFQSLTHAKPQESHGRSFMLTRPINQHSAIDLSIWHDFIYSKKGPVGGGLQLIGAYQKSRTSRKAERYFLFGGKNCLLVSGDANAEDKCIRDIRAEWINLPSDFRGFLSIDPHQEQMGFTFQYNQDIKKIIKLDSIKHYWINISLPLVHVKNDIRLMQNIQSTSTCAFSPESPCDIINAFRQKSWCFGKIGCKHDITRLAEINVKLGQTFLAKDNFQVAYYSGISIPTSAAQDPEFLFSPVAGFNRHIGILAGVHFQLRLNRDTSLYSLAYYLALDNIFLVRNKQCRTIDLKNKPWSRFMLFNKKNDPPDQNLPGVNVLTQRVLVRAYNTIDFSTGWRFRTSWFESELGFNIWGHPEERIKLQDPNFKETFGIAGPGALEDGVIPLKASTASKSDIAQRADNDEEFIAVRECDLDFDSASASSALSYKIHLVLGVHHHGEKVGGFFGFGTFLEFPHKNGSLKTWGVWAKLGGTF